MFHVMVVEDDLNTRKLMGAVLKQNGYEPILATDGEDALEKMESNHVDLIILDIMMPRMDGYEFTKILREGDCNIPILMVTAKESMADKRRGFGVGTDDYMVKPVDEEEMLLRQLAIYAKRLWGPKRFLPALLAKGFSRDAIRTALLRAEAEGIYDSDAIKERLLADLGDDDPAARRAWLYKHGF